ncbi:helix-turn-helix domain-containing protein [Pseudoduganella sp. GCM10020061]|uniref:helix-turn-helix domain-containing protein n=1 Tax=Pseudoduganella sp. GCM10020061 TaxID=3317345 RepID=UPI00363C8460
MPPRSNPPPTVFGRRLRQARERHQLPQDVLGVLAGLEESSSSARISRYESGIHEPSHRFASSLAEVLRIPTAFLYCDDDGLAEIILGYSQLSEAGRHALLASTRDLLSIETGDST